MNEFYLGLFHPEINEVTTTTSAPTDITGDFFGANPFTSQKLWLIDKHPTIHAPPRNSRPFDESLLTIGFP